MRTNLKLLAAAISIFGAALSIATPHDRELKAPNGGRLVTGVEPHAEIFVADDGQVKVTFLDDEGVILEPAKQLVTLVGGNRMHPITLGFEKEGDSFVSVGKLPVDERIPVVLQIQEELGGKTYRERFQLNMASCPTCEYKEYACACHDEGKADDHGDSHSHGGGHSHSH